MLLILTLSAIGSVPVLAQGNSFVLDRDGRTIVLEPYAANIIRVTLSKTRDMATAPAGYGSIGTPSIAGWTHEQGNGKDDVFRSGRLVVHVSPDHLPESLLPNRMPLDPLNQSLRDQYFGRANGHRPADDTISITTASGNELLTMTNWSMRPNPPEASAATTKKQQNEAGDRVSARFDSPAGEHYYGLGQQQQGALDLRDHKINCWQDYSAIGGQNVCVPFMVSSRGYGLIWDNPSKTTIDLGLTSKMSGPQR